MNNNNHNNNKNHVISVMVKDEAGIVSRVSGLFSGRGYSIESITAAQTSEKGYARITIETSGGDADVIEQITKQLNRLIPVLKVVDSIREQRKKCCSW